MGTELERRQGGEQKFVPSRVAEEELCACSNTLRRWADAGLLPYYRTPGGQRRYDVGTFLARLRQDPRV
jgi:hypothetical protein